MRSRLRGETPGNFTSPHARLTVNACLVSLLESIRFILLVASAILLAAAALQLTAEYTSH